ncbi:hypothetical protein RIF29_03538 [Crotalaria pallida]|uniref:Uncharacterized protein n=1 Tax=Crotalaria pallida TaxID=3830 RepID=A0AAN9J018_CROPI
MARCRCRRHLHPLSISHLPYLPHSHHYTDENSGGLRYQPLRLPWQITPLPSLNVEDRYREDNIWISRHRRNKVKKGNFADETNATTESDIEETLKRLVFDLKKSPQEVFDALKNPTVEKVKVPYFDVFFEEVL